MPDSDMTPGRLTTVDFDVDEFVRVEPEFTARRDGADIAADVKDGQGHALRASNVRFWPSGCWTLEPLQQEVSNISEKVVGIHTIQTTAGSTVVPILGATAVMTTQNLWRARTDLPGMAASEDVAAFGDAVFVKEIPAGGTWDNQLSGDVTALPLVSGIPQDIPVDRMGVSDQAFPPDQAFFVRLGVPGHAMAYYDSVFAFYFGQYAVHLTGSGVAQLWEHVYTSDPAYVGVGGPSWVWKQRAQWQYARTAQVAGTAHTMAIWPHVGPGGERLICFTNSMLQVAQGVDALSLAPTAGTATGDYVYKISPGTRSPYDAPPPDGAVTISAPFRFDIRRDLRLRVQVSTLGWPTSGYLVDNPIALPPNVSGYAPMVVRPRALTPAGTTLSWQLLDTATGQPFVPGAGPGMVPPGPLGGQYEGTSAYAVFTFAGDGTTTPVLYSYDLHQDAVYQAVQPGAFSVSGEDALTGVSVVGFTGDPSHQSASVDIKDVQARLDRLAARGQLSVNVRTSVPGLGQDVSLFRGYAMRPEATHRGRPGRPFPSPDWRNFHVPMVGMWQRLQEIDALGIEGPFVQDPSLYHNPGDPLVPWKVTDAVRYLLGSAGFPDFMIADFDSPVRLWPGAATPTADYIVSPGDNLGEKILRWCRNFLGAFLCFDENLGPYGAWDVVFGTRPSAAPVWDFTTEAASPLLPPHLLAAYPQGTSPVFGAPQYTNVPPEFNAVHVIASLPLTTADTRTACDNWAFNPVSYPCPGFAAVSDPDSPDYLGRMRVLTVYDPSLTDTDPARTQYAVDWLCRRFFDFYCHGQVLAYFQAPLVFLQDPLRGHWRPIRFQDPVSINGVPGYLVRAVNATYDHDRVQMAEYEVIRPLPGQSVIPGMDALRMFRQAQRRDALTATGHGTRTNLYGNLGVAPAGEHRYQKLPAYPFTRAPLQDVYGNFAYLQGYDDDLPPFVPGYPPGI